MTISILILLALVGAMPVLAQPNSGAVRVLVRDHAEAVLPGVRIVLDGPSTGKAQLTETAPHSSRVSLWALTSSH